MANTPTTPASVAARLTDEEIERLASKLTDAAGQSAAMFGEEHPAYIEETNVAAVLRDYVRLRICVTKIKRLLAAAEEGETK